MSSSPAWAGYIVNSRTAWVLYSCLLGRYEQRALHPHQRNDSTQIQLRVFIGLPSKSRSNPHTAVILEALQPSVGDDLPNPTQIEALLQPAVELTFHQLLPRPHAAGKVCRPEGAAQITGEGHQTLPNVPTRDSQSWKDCLWVLTPALKKMVMAVMVSGQHSTTLSYLKRPCLRKQKQNRSSDIVFSLSAGSSPCKISIPLRYRMVLQNWREAWFQTSLPF